VKVLFLTHRLPYAPDRGDRIRAFHMLRSLAAHSAVELVSLVHDARERAEADGLARRLGIRVTTLPVPALRNRVAAAVALAGNRPLTHVLLDSPALRPVLEEIVRERPPDVVLAYCSGMARVAMESPLDRYPMILDMVDLDSAKWAALAGASHPPLRWVYAREARQLAAFERQALMRAKTTLAVVDREAEAVRALEPRADVRVVSNGVDVGALEPRAAPVDEPRVVFCGVMNYAPNVAGIVWFAREVWPSVRRMCPAATLTIVGSDPVADVRRLATEERGITVTGRVAEVAPYLWNAAVSIAPMSIARGLQNKVLEAVTAGLPAVVTSAVFEGLPNEVRRACRVADSPDEFSRQVIRLLRAPGTERRAIAGRANCAAMSWDEQLAPLRQLLVSAVASARPTRLPCVVSL
jgi:sugar transferase (PEP-CTERM/EpsH1 system associated)